MSKSAKQSDLGSTAVGTEDLSTDGMLEVLSNQHRRFAIHALKQSDAGTVTVSELAEGIASWEYEKEIDQLSYKERKRVHNALRQFHLPKMDEHGFVEYDSQRGVVQLTDTAASTDFYVDSLTGREIPWGLYYLSLAALSVVGLIGLWFQMYPFTLARHFYDNYCRMRLGAREEPPEVEE